MHNWKICFAVFLLLAASDCVFSAGSAAPSPDQMATLPNSALAGNYTWGNEFERANLQLFSGGRFKESIYSDAGDAQTGAFGSYVYGRYSVKDGVLVLSPQYSTPGQGAKPEYANKRSRWSGGVIRLLPVRWGSRLYFLGQHEQELDFCNAINLGDEPRAPGKRREGSSFFLRVGDEKKPVTGLPQLPQQWSSYLLSAPIAGKIISVGKGSTAIVNVGKTDKVKLGMIFTYSKPNSVEATFKVIALQNHQATLKNEITWWANIKVGDKVSTHHMRSNFK